MKTLFLPPLAVLATAAPLALALAPAASAERGPCLPGERKPVCHVWTGKAGPVDDGDTINVNLDGDGTSRQVKIRLAGIQAMELRSYSRKQGRSGECHAVAAAERLERLIRGARSRVRVAAMRVGSSTGARHRLRRSIAVKDGGKWVDVGSILMAEGHGLPFPNGNEWASNGLYSQLAQGAAARKKNLWNPAGCPGGRPAPTSALTLKLKWDAEDDDRKNINGEWVRIKNPGATPVSLRGWWLRDSHFRGPRAGDFKGRGYAFPANAVVPAGSSIRVHVGRGKNNATDLYWGLAETIFENATDDKTKAGDGAYLFDGPGNLRAYAMYPCRAGNCTEPLAGKVNVVARYAGLEHEWVTITNTSSAPISLSEYELESVPWFYEFGPRDFLLPGKSTVVWIDKPHAIPLGDAGVRRQFFNPVAGFAPFQSAVSFKSWGHKALLGDGKDVVTLRNPQGAPVKCDAWGGERCPGV